MSKTSRLISWFFVLLNSAMCGVMIVDGKAIAAVANAVVALALAFQLETYEVTP